MELIAKSGMRFVKISTEFSFPDATEENVKLLYSVSRSRPNIKASSGIKAKEQGVKFLLLGAESICIF
jgi:deoxyribose-phosphate aldolase